MNKPHAETAKVLPFPRPNAPVPEFKMSRWDPSLVLFLFFGFSALAVAILWGLLG